MIFHVRPIASCPRYFASDTGRIWGPRKELKASAQSTGVLTFSVHLKGFRRTMKVAHAVAETFLGPQPPGAWVCHRNDKPTDNRVENLYYGNASTNLRDAFRNGRRSHKGERHWSAKLTWEQVNMIRKGCAAGIRQSALAKRYGVSHTTIWDIVHNRRWRNKP